MGYDAEPLQRLQLLLGSEAVNKIKNSSVAVIGLGGVGSHAVEALARSGIHHITIVDPDRVEMSNMNRQLPALTSTINRFKTDVIAGRLLDINPGINIKAFTCSYEPLTSEQILDLKTDYVVDAIDSIPDKVHLIKTCLEKEIPIVSSMGMANRTNPMLLKIGDIKETTVCPVAKKVRKELRSCGIETGLKVVFSTETPVKTSDKNPGSLGSIIFLPGIAGYLLANLIIEMIIT
ncbi:MAG: tRNA threonylcarbamoyladenosine dehydratase [Syntrophomonadaceae bacterium]|jgi:tRNA A37 threonylcarbamoyladenosine dehydratase|nr:tRNA threonylcarbamoyladenosine dehydratase [Syntrophomonadaceae bacterium]